MPNHEVQKAPIQIDTRSVTEEGIYDRLTSAETWTWPEVMSKFTEEIRSVENFEENEIGQAAPPDAAQSVTEGIFKYLIDEGEGPQEILIMLVREITANTKPSNESGFLAGLGMTFADNDMATQAIELINTQSESILEEHKTGILLAIAEAYARDADKLKALDYIIRAYETNHGLDPEHAIHDFEFMIRLDGVLNTLTKLVDHPSQSTSA